MIYDLVYPYFWVILNEHMQWYAIRKFWGQYSGSSNITKSYHTWLHLIMACFLLLVTSNQINPCFPDCLPRPCSACQHASMHLSMGAFINYVEKILKIF